MKFFFIIVESGNNKKNNDDSNNNDNNDNDSSNNNVFQVRLCYPLANKWTSVALVLAEFHPAGVDLVPLSSANGACVVNVDSSFVVVALQVFKSPCP